MGKCGKWREVKGNGGGNDDGEGDGRGGSVVKSHKGKPKGGGSIKEWGRGTERGWPHYCATGLDQDT